MNNSVHSMNWVYVMLLNYILLSHAHIFQKKRNWKLNIPSKITTTKKYNNLKNAPQKQGLICSIQHKNNNWNIIYIKRFFVVYSKKKYYNINIKYWINSERMKQARVHHGSTFYVSCFFASQSQWEKLNLNMQI